MSRAELGVLNLNGWTAKYMEMVEKRGVQCLQGHETKRRVPYNRYHATFRHFQAAIQQQKRGHGVKERGEIDADSSFDA